MFNALIDWSVRNRLLVMLLAVTLVVWGTMRAGDSDMDVFPEFAPPQVIVETDAPGLVAQEVEALVSHPLETAINGTPGVTLVKSVSQAGVSLITVTFQYGSDIYTARQLISEKVQSASSRLPKLANLPQLLPIMSAVGDILKIGMTSDRLSPMQLRTMADWTVRNRVLAVPGVARVYVMGGDVKQFLVLVNPEKLKSFGVNLSQVRVALEKSNVVAPAGYLSEIDKQLPIQVLGRVRHVEDIAESVVETREGVPVLIKHIAKVEVGPAFKYGDAIVNGKPGVELVISRQPGCNTLDVTRRVEAALAEVKKGLPSDVQFVTIFRQANFIERSIENVMVAIATGGILVVLILLIFLSNWRTALISLVAIPLSLLSAILVIKYSGGSVNTMTLGGLAIAVGEVVDDAIVDVENVFRRLRESRLTGRKQPTIAIIVNACREVRSSVVYATFVVALVFVPVFCLSGTEGKIFSPLGYAYVVATLSSLLVALTVTPAMCVLLLSNVRTIASNEPWVVLLVKQAYSMLLSVVLKFPRFVLISSILVFLGTLTLLPSMGQEFLPQFKEDALILAMYGLPGQSLEATTRIGTAVEQKLLQHKEVVAVGQRAGRAELDDDAGAPSFSEFDIQVKESSTRSVASILEDIRKHMDEIPGITYDVGSFIEHRMEDVLSGGTRAQIVIKIFGHDIQELRNLSQRVATELKSARGAVDVRTESLVLLPQVTIKLNRERAARYGISADDLSRNLETAFNGAVVSEVLDGQKLFGLKVWLDESARHNLQELRTLLIDTANGNFVLLEQVADVSITDSPNAVIRENVMRRIVVQANTSGRDVVSVVNEAKAKIARIALPEGYYIVYSGEYAAQQEASQRLLASSLLALIGILVLLRQGLGSWRNTMLVASNLPLATIGGIIAVALTGNVISIGSLIGFISLFGISTRNSLLLVTHINALEERGMAFEQAIQKGCLARVSPVLMTALTAALGMLPLAIMGGSGRELEQPLAVVIIGGLASSTALTLIVIPALFTLYAAPVVRPAESNEVPGIEESMTRLP
jgi:CzcA family heavy metal efflux pump